MKPPSEVTPEEDITAAQVVPHITPETATETRHIGALTDDTVETDASTGRNIIVAIGINEYQHQPPLDNPINDAQAVLRLFKECGFQELPGVPSLIANDATRSAIAALPEQLVTELTADDNLVVFFAGHGEKREKQAPDPAQPGRTYTHRTGYLIPVDGPKDKPGEWIRLDAFLDEISGLPARHIFVILDACKSGIALAEKFKVKGGDQPTTVAALRRLPSRRVMTSAMHDEKAAEGGSGSGHSVFAEALIAAVQDRQADKDGDGYIKTVDLFSFVQDRVSDRARKLFRLKQTPDYGYLPGDGSGDLVISLAEGAFNRLIEKALSAMLRHDVPRLESLVAQLVAANPDYPTTLYLQFRLRFMRADYVGAAQALSILLASDFNDASVPLSREDLTDLRIQLDYWGPLLEIPAGTPPIRLRMLSGPDAHRLHLLKSSRLSAHVCYKVENNSIAQFQVTNTGDDAAHLYYLTVVPNGRLVILPLLEGDAGIDGLAPGATGSGQMWKVKGLPGAITEMRVFYSPRRISDLLLARTTHTRELQHLSTNAIADMRMMVVYNQIMKASISPSNETGPSLWIDHGPRVGRRPGEKKRDEPRTIRETYGGGRPGASHKGGR